jgi:hypothetical protein
MASGLELAIAGEFSQASAAPRHTIREREDDEIL